MSMKTTKSERQTLLNFAESGMKSVSVGCDLLRRLVEDAESCSGKGRVWVLIDDVDNAYCGIFTESEKPEDWNARGAGWEDLEFSWDEVKVKDA